MARMLAIESAVENERFGIADAAVDVEHKSGRAIFVLVDRADRSRRVRLRNDAGHVGHVGKRALHERREHEHRPKIFARDDAAPDIVR